MMNSSQKQTLQLLCQKVQQSTSITGVFSLVRLGMMLAHKSFSGEQELERLATTTLLMQMKKDKPLALRTQALVILCDLYFHCYFQNDLPLQNTVLQTIIHAAQKDSNKNQRLLAIEALGQILNRASNKDPDNFSIKTATALIRIAKNVNEDFELRQRTVYFLDLSVDNLSFHPTSKIKSLSSHFPATGNCPETDYAMRLLPHRIRSISFRRQTGALPKNHCVLAPCL